ncbi:MAG: hypothetical protein HXY53_00855 [Nitrospirae bacterium]|nr:hypothetical protein [Nitrospirota bacterium]
MIPDIIDNSSPKKTLSNVLNELIRPESKVYIASGYFNLSGFKLLKDRLKDAAEVSIIIGRALGPKDIYASEVFLDELRHEAESSMDSPHARSIVQEFLEWLDKDNVNFRIYNKHFYHGKTYIVEGIPVIGSIGVVGSSNFTEAGLTHNTELNTVQKQESAVSELKKVFERIWNEGEDYKEDLKDLYMRFTETYSPYEIYLKTLYSYFEDKFASVSPEDNIPSPIILSDFQRDGYLSALDIFERYGGVLLSDSVGLGKTYLALRILDDFAYRLRQKALIICPAQLKGILWEPKLRDAGIRADIVSRETVSRVLPLEQYADYDLIVVDESHNFRNSNTNCWKNLFSILIQGKSKKLVLITATPVNNSVFDLYNQIRLITKDRDDYFSVAGIQSLWGHFLKADVNKDTLYDLLDEIAIRRSRPFIRKYYPSALIDGEPVKFPERKLYEVRYNLEKTYKGLYDECAKTIENLTLASYNIEAYRKEMIGKQIELFETLKGTLLGKGWKENDAQKFLMVLGRNEAVIAILKMMLLKRLESSIPAFKISIKRLIDFQEKFLEVFEKGKLLSKDKYRKFYLSNESDDLAEEETISLEELPSIKAEDYETEKIKTFVNLDIKILKEIYSKIEDISAVDDDKLQVLREILKNNLKGKKVLIFGYFKDTMRYLHKQLGGNKAWLEKDAPINEKELITDFLNNINLSHNEISITDSDIPPEDRKKRIIAFSPESNNRPDIMGTDEEIHILLSTDVLSEGQNLQDADTVINYDLPWNPVRLIQRIGRIDRLKSKHDFVHIYNFFPEDALESLLKLMERLYKKLDAINRSVGLDASTIGETPNPKEFGYVHQLYEGKAEVLNELENLSELAIGEFLKEEVLKYLQDIGEERIKRIPHGMGSGLKRPGHHGLFVSFKDSSRHHWCYYDFKNKKISEDKLNVIRLIRCRRDEERTELDFDPYEIIEKVRSHIISRLRTAKLKPPKLKSPQNHVVNWLQCLSGNVRNELMEYFSTPLPDIYLRELRKIWAQRGLSEEALLTSLKTFKENHPVQPQEEKEISSEEPELKLVSYMGIMG